jgi:hypothetical protein
MIRLRVRHLAEERGYNLSTFQRAASLPMTTTRRVWFSTSDGSPAGPPLKTLSFDVLETLADFFETDVGNLLERTSSR